MNTRHFVTFTLTMLQAGGVTRPQIAKKDAPDAVVDTDVQGRVFVPGTSLTGALRAHWAQVHGDEATDEAFGTVHGERAAPSRWWVADAIGPALDDELLLTRQRTAIDSGRGAAMQQTLRTRQRLHAGVVFHGYLMIEDATEVDLSQLKQALQTWHPLLGSGISTGQGLCEVGDVRCGCLELTSETDLLTWLTYSGPELARRVATARVEYDPQPRDELLWRTRWRVAGPLLVTRTTRTPDGRTEIGPEMEAGRPVVPGSSLKGVVRGRMGFILRSVGVDACVIGTDENHRHQAVCGQCLLCRWFGYSGGEHDGDAVGARGRMIPRTATITGGRSREAVIGKRTRVAIDRFTGGVAARSKRTPPTQGVPKIRPPGSRGGQLFTMRAVEDGELDLQWDVTALDTSERALAAALLRLVYQDLHDGLIGLGGSVHSGYGDVRAVGAEDAAGNSEQLEDFLPLRDARRRLASLKETNGGPDD